MSTPVPPLVALVGGTPNADPSFDVKGTGAIFGVHQHPLLLVHRPLGAQAALTLLAEVKR